MVSWHLTEYGELMLLCREPTPFLLIQKRSSASPLSLLVNKTAHDTRKEWQQQSADLKMGMAFLFQCISILLLDPWVAAIGLSVFQSQMDWGWESVTFVPAVSLSICVTVYMLSFARLWDNFTMLDMRTRPKSCRDNPAWSLSQAEAITLLGQDHLDRKRPCWAKGKRNMEFLDITSGLDL